MSLIPNTLINKLFSLVNKSIIKKICFNSVCGLFFIYKYGMQFARSPVKRLLFSLIYKRMMIKKSESKQSIVKNNKSYIVISNNSFPIFFGKEDDNFPILFVNNFQSKFEGLEKTQFNSIKTRFTSIDFEKCDKSEIIKYLKVFNSKLINTQYYYEEDHLNRTVNRIRDDIKMTYQDISIYHIRAQYDIEKLVDFINEGFRIQIH